MSKYDVRKQRGPKVLVEVQLDRTVMWLEYAEQWKALWKQTAKYWYSGDGHEQVYELGYADGYSAANDDASGRLELLRSIEDFVQVCPICLIRIVDHPFDIFKKASGHAPDCKLARELENE